MKDKLTIKRFIKILCGCAKKKKKSMKQSKCRQAKQTKNLSFITPYSQIPQVSQDKVSKIVQVRNVNIQTIMYTLLSFKINGELYIGTSEQDNFHFLPSL